MNSYKTIKQPAREEYVINKSRFIGHACPCQAEEQALAFLKRIREEYRDATHNCYAYVIGENAGIMRYSDDGEPGGTAGLPMMEVLKARGVVNLCVVVTRYFGGTLLGTGGLVHTYGASAKQGLIESELVIRKLCDIVSVKVDYSLLGKMQHEIMTKGYLLEDTIYEDEVTFIISCPIDTTDKVIAEIINMTNAGAVCEKIDKKYVDVKEEEG